MFAVSPCCYLQVQSFFDKMIFRNYELADFGHVVLLTFFKRCSSAKNDPIWWRYLWNLFLIQLRTR